MTAPTTPRWVTAYATTSGDDPALIGTRAIPRWCRGCGLLLLAGYDAPTIAGLATCDPHPLTPTLEQAAVILARPTYRLWGAPGRYELTRRTPTWNNGLHLPPASGDVVVVAAHDCGRPPLTHEPLPAPERHAFDSDGPPPF